MISQCSVTMECRLEQTLDLPAHDLFIGGIVATHCDEGMLDGNGIVDFARVRPILFIMNDRGLWRLGEKLAQAWSVGMETRDRLKEK